MSSTASTLAPDSAAPALLPIRASVLMFLAFALGYFASALVRAIMATLSPVLTAEFQLQAADLGLLAGGFFLGFASTQIPLGNWLDRHGPKRVVLGFMVLAVLACLAFAWSSGFVSLLAARVLMGMGLSACLMAPLTSFRRWYEPAHMLRANSWMLMVGSLGMVASTLPVQWLLPLFGWRPLFVGLAVLVLLSMLLVVRWVPPWPAATANPTGTPVGYGPILHSRAFWRLVPLGLVNYAGMVGMQTLWAGPWLTRVTGQTPAQAAQGLLLINLSMLMVFWAWGWFTPALFRRGFSVERLLRWGVPLSLAMLAVNIAGGASIGWVGWAAFCVLSSVISLAQPALGMKFDASLAGRALSAYNLVIFLGIFLMQWGVGLMIDLARARGWSEAASFQAAFAVYGVCCVGAYLFFVLSKEDNPRP